MKEIYILSKPLYLYKDSNYFFSTLQRRKKLSKEELRTAFPNGNAINAYMNKEDAEQAVRKARAMRLVADTDNLKGVDYHSRVTPVIFKVKLRKDIDENNPIFTIHFDEINKKIPAQIICLEKKFDAFLPKEIDLKINQFPSSYEKIFSRGYGDLRDKDELKHSGLISMFGDYCGHKIYYLKGFEKLDLFFHGHWNRHHVDIVQSVMNKYDPHGLNEGDDIVGFLNDLKLKLIEAREEINPKGSLARRIAYAQGKIGQDIIDVNEINDEIAAGLKRKI
ncbi:MAG: DUF5617 domain-containing protein [Legionella sp.]|nr:DUF5617 domain-containing protein [Legionella sp.]